MRRRIALSTVLAALVGVLAAGLVALGLVRTSYDAQARANLHQQAEVLATALDTGNARLTQKPLLRRALGIQYTRIRPDDVKRTLPDDVVRAAAEGRALSTTEALAGRRFLFEVVP